ncbi:MAG: RNA polymerase factor sigma-54 [Planctomycetaceae bacterium]
MRLDVSLSQRLGLQLKLAPQIIQSIEILQLPAQALQELIETELGENEALERADESAPDPPVEQPSAPADAAANGQAEETRLEVEMMRDTMEKLESLENAAERDWQDFGRRGFRGGDEDPKFEAMNNTAASTASLSETLHEQFLLLEPDETERIIGRHIIFNLEASGILPYSLEELLEGPELKGRFTLEDAERTLRLVQRLEPRGVGARNLKEVLLLQLAPGDPDRELKARLIRDHLEEINKNKRPKIARDLGIDIAEVNRLIEEIAKLDPRPGAVIGDNRNAYVNPDVVVEWIDGKYEVILEDGFFPRIRVNPQYRDLLANSTDPEVKEFVRKKLESAKWLVDAIQQRQNTLQRVCDEIFQVQREYLDFGKDHLHPLKMQEIADRVGIHVSTVSRAIADKWAQTPRGIVPLKFFFTGGAETTDGEMLSRMSVKQRVKEIIANEDKKSPLSDEEVADELKKQGLDIARRTVTKYRKGLKIPSSRQRREWS